MLGADVGPVAGRPVGVANKLALIGGTSSCHMAVSNVSVRKFLGLILSSFLSFLSHRKLQQSSRVVVVGDKDLDRCLSG